MGHAFKVLIPICIFSFIGFVITSALFGAYSSSSHPKPPVATETSYEEHFNDGTEEKWELSGNYNKINLDIGAYSVKVIPISGDVTTFTLSGTIAGDADIGTYVNEDSLFVEIDSKSFDIEQFIGNLADAIKTGEGWDKLFGSGQLTIGVPDKEYDEVRLMLGSGKAVINRIDSRFNSFSIGSGVFEYNGTGFACDEMLLDMGSGKVTMSNAPCGSYDIEIGSGVFEINGISGGGNFVMGSGSGTLEFSEVNGNGYFDIGSGSLDIFIPERTDAVVSADVGSGRIKIDDNGKQSTIRDGHDGESYTYGNGENEFSFILGSGSVNISNGEAAATTAVSSEVAVEEVTDVAVATTIPTEVTVAEVVEEAIAA